MNDFAIPATAPEIDAQIAELTLQETSTPQASSARRDRLEALHIAKAAAAEGAPPARGPVTGQAPAPTEDEAYPAPATAMEYQFQPPPGVEIVNEAAAGAVKGALFEAGVPAPLADAAFQQIAEMHVAGAFADAGSYDAAVAQCKASIHAKHGDAAPAMLRDAAAYLNRLADQHPALEDAVAQAMASPFIVAQAANLHRYGTTRGRK